MISGQSETNLFVVHLNKDVKSRAKDRKNVSLPNSAFKVQD